MATRVLPTDLDRSGRDFDALKDRLERSARSVFPAWTDFGQANFGVIMLEALAYIGDQIAYYQDANARESRLATCVKRINGIRHARALGYTFAGATAASGNMRFTLRAAMPKDVLFPKGSIVRSASATDPVRVQTLADLTVLAGSLTGTIAAENSESHTETFESDDASDQQFELSFTPYLTIVSISDSIGTYSLVENFLDSLPTDRHVIVRVSEESRALLQFGDAVNGKVPTGTITVEYKTGGGSVTIESGSLTVPEFVVTDLDGNPASFDASNDEAFPPGQDYESLAHARVSAPAAVRTLTRSVCREDYEINARRVSGIDRALMLTSDQYAGLPENYGQLRVIARGTELSSGRFAPAVPSSTQMAAVLALITDEYPPTITFRFDVLPPTFKTIDITARVYLAEGVTAATVDAAIRSALADFFACTLADETPNTSVDFGFNYRDELGEVDASVAWSDLFNVVRDVTGVRKVDEDAFVPTDDVPLTIYEFPKLGTVTLINARTGLPLA